MSQLKMLRAGLVLALAIALAITARSAALAQVGSALGNDSLIHQSNIQAGIDDLQKRAATETPYRIVKDVQKALDDADPVVRVEALKKLRNLNSPEVTPLLLRGLVDPDIRVKIKAIDLLGDRETTEAVPQMSQMLFLRSTDPAVKLHLVAALGRIGDARGALPAMQYLEEQTDMRSRGTAVFALGEIGDARATDILTNVATEDKSDTVRRLAQEAIEKIDGELPTQHGAKAKVAESQDRQLVPTDQRLSKLRKIDEEIQQQH